MSNPTKPKTAALTMPTDPFAILSMQSLDKRFEEQPAFEEQPTFEEQPAEEATTQLPALTEARTPVSAYGRTDVSADGRKQARTPVPAGASKQVRKGVPAEPAAAEPAVTEEGLVAFVEGRLASREPLIGGVKATVDMSPDLSSRAKRYLADHRGQSTRQILIELFDAFLTVKGY